MENKHIKELMAVMQRTGTKRLVIKKDGMELQLEREDRYSSIDEPSLELMEDNPMRQEILLHRANMLLSRGGDISATLPYPKEIKESSKEPADATGTHIKSPMVGTFYQSPSADDAPFIKVGDKIEKDTVVCIVEAMKVMNEVKAGVAGIIAEILVENAHPVEFGTKLFRIT